MKPSSSNILGQQVSNGFRNLGTLLWNFEVGGGSGAWSPPTPRYVGLKQKAGLCQQTTGSLKDINMRERQLGFITDYLEIL